MQASLKPSEESATEWQDMIEFRYRRILLVQSIFLILMGILSYELSQNSIQLAFLWFFGIILNLLFIKKFALPSITLLEKLGSRAFLEDLSWSEIEESIAKKNRAMNQQKEHFEQENLKYKLLLDSLEDPVCILNKELIIIYANQSFIGLFHFSENKLPVPLIEVSRNLEFQEFLENAVEVETTSRRSYFTFNQLADHHKNYYDLKVFPVDNINNYLCLLHDVTERKHADQMREDFVANFSHEVRTPLTILNGQMQNLKMELEKTPDFESRFASSFVKIENNSRRLINLFNDLLTLNSVETKKEIKKEEVDLEEMLTYLVQDLMLNYPDKKIDIDLKIEHKTFFVDYRLFEQVMINLIDNSLKYILKAGKIVITSESLGDYDMLTISDNGVGIPEDQLHRIFERFFRVDSSRSSEIAGTGLGLSIVKHIIHKHEGKIKVSANPSGGTIFTILLPKN